MNDQNIQNRILWMMDETLASTHPANWQRVRELEGSLVGLMGNPDFTHELVDPLPCLRSITRQLQDEEFSTVLDLTGWLTPALFEIFPDTPIEDRFSLSRVRVVSSPRLETTGYRLAMSSNDVRRLRQVMDLRKPLIVDDVSFSGWTSRKTMDIWGLDPDVTTHAFLIANTGDLGSDPGAVPMLESTGSRVIFGHEMKTPRDDGWHLKDLHQNPNLQQAFILALLFQESLRKDGAESALVQRFFSHETVIKTMFPDFVTSGQIKNLIEEGRFILRNRTVIDGDELHARNPFLWASPYFQDHVDMNRVSELKNEAVAILGELRLLTTDPAGKREASLELKREVQRARTFNNPEGQFSGIKERL